MDASLANFRGADLRGASLHAVSLEGADLTAANVAGARLEDTVVTGATVTHLAGVDDAEVVSILTDEGRLVGAAATDWLRPRSGAPAP